MIELQNVHFFYRTNLSDFPVLRGIDLIFRDGERVALMGANGSGKTTLARCLNGLLLPTQGRVLVDGLPTDRPDALWEVRRRVQMVFQNPDDQLVSVLVEREIAFGLENLGVPPAEMRQRVEEMLRRFRLEGYRNHPPHLLSGGEKQRLAVASALAMRPRHLVLDEPTAMLDPEGRREVMATLDDLARAGDVTLVHITQTPEEAAAAHRLIVLGRGLVAMDGPPEQVFAEPRLGDLGLAPPAPARLWAALGGPGPAPLTPEGLAEKIGPHPPLRQGASAQILPSLSQWEREGKGEGEVSSPLIITESLEHTYNRGLPTERRAVAGVDVEINRGTFTALIGASGSGKTTFVQHLNALLRPTRGRVLIDGEDLWRRGVDLRRIRQRVGLIFQFAEFQVFEETVAADVAFGPRNLGWDEERISGAVQRALEQVGLDPAPFGPRSPLTLSGGERRRVAIAGVLAMQPEALVLDEPAAGLDPRGAAQMEGLLAGLHADGRTLLLVAHDMDLVARLAQRVVVMHQGRIVLDGPPRQVFRRSQELLSLGLDLPDAVRIADALRSRGWPISSDAMTLEEVAEEVMRHEGNKPGQGI
jgi:energy-coupling factor transport system ATP-binding protein